MSDDLTEIIATLRAKRAEHLSAVGTLDEAIDALTKLTGAARQTTGQRSPGTLWEGGAPVDGRTGPATPSVLQLVVALTDEAPRSWNTDEIVKEYENRGTPLRVMDPQNAVFSALARGAKSGRLRRIAKGRYAAERHAERVLEMEGELDPWGTDNSPEAAEQAAGTEVEA